MTTITKTERSGIGHVVDNHYMNKLHVRCYLSTQDVRGLYWDDDTIRRVDDVHSIISKHQIHLYAPDVTVTVEVSHPLHPTPFNVTIEVSLSDRDVLWPRSPDMKDFRRGHDGAVAEKFMASIREMARLSIDAGVFKEVTNFIIDECSSHEAARYLFPPYLAILRHQHSYIARKVEQVSRPPTLPKRPFMMQEKIRYAIQWFATQELLGRWDSYRREDRPGDTTQVRFNTTPSINLEHVSGQTFNLPARI